MISHTHHGTADSLWVSIALIAAASWYFLRWLRARVQHGDKVQGWRAASFAIGLGFIWIATASPLGALDHEMLTVHMVQHLLLMTLAPPLVLLGWPGNLITAAGSLRSVAGRQVRTALTHPAVCWLAAAGTLVVWHMPGVFRLALRSQSWHAVEQACFLVTGLMFWWPVVQPSASASKWPESSIILYLFLATLPCDILSGFLVFCDRVVYQVFLSSSQSFGLSALEDQQCAGALMWTCVTVVYLIAGAVFTARLLSPCRFQERAIPQFDSSRIAIRQRNHGKMETV
jgi:putative membrane protein